MKILYVGPRFGTSLHRFRAFQRLGHEVDFVDPRPGLIQSQLGYSWTHATGGLFVSLLVLQHLKAEVADRHYDVAYVDSGELIDANAVRWLSSRARRVVSYNPDNPYQGRDGRKWRLFKQALPEYDLVVVPRASNLEEAYAAGAKRVLLVTFAADELVHRPPLRAADDAEHYVVFVGTWMPERGPFMARLLERGVPLAIFGPRWSRAPEFGALSRVVNEQFHGDDAYVRIIAGAQVALALVSVGNRDLHTTRSLEIPAIGTLLCAERTSDHLAMYRENEEAVFWSDADQCADLCLELLADQPRIERIARAGHERLLRDGHLNETVLSRILAQLD